MLQWLENTFEIHKDRIFKFASYHVPLYPSTPYTPQKEWENEDPLKENKYGRSIWQPLFDKYNLTAAFENHVHAMKGINIFIFQRFTLLFKLSFIFYL